MVDFAEAVKAAVEAEYPDASVCVRANLQTTRVIEIEIDAEDDGFSMDDACSLDERISETTEHITELGFSVWTEGDWS